MKILIDTHAALWFFQDDERLTKSSVQAIFNLFVVLEILPKHIKALTKLPFIHRDPFERILVAQALVEEMFIITADENIKKHEVNTIW